MKGKYNTTHRGFGRIDFEDLYGSECSLQKSSLATDDAIWLGANELLEDHVTKTLHNQRMHLNREQAVWLIRQLQHFADTGEVSSPNA